MEEKRSLYITQTGQGRLVAIKQLLIFLWLLLEFHLNRFYDFHKNFLRWYVEFKYMEKGVDVICSTSWPKADAILTKDSIFIKSSLQLFFLCFYVILKQAIWKQNVFRMNECSMFFNQFLKLKDLIELVDSYSCFL